MRRGWVATSLALVAMGPILWMLSPWLVRLVYDERVPFMSERMFRSRDVYDLDFYLELTATARLAFTACLLGLGLLMGLRALRDAPGLSGRLGRRGWRVAQGTVMWAPASPWAQTIVVMASGAGIALASGYRAVPRLGNDVVTYMPVARKYFDEGYLLGDLPIRDPDAALLAWGWIIRLLALPFGFDGAFFAVSLLGGAVLAYGLHRLVTQALGGGHRAGMFAAVVGLTVTFGEFGYSLAVPSHANFYPTPRFLAIAISVVAISLVLERAFLRGVLLGLASTAVNTLDGLIPVGLAILAVLLVGDTEPKPREESRRIAAGLAVVATATAFVAFGVRSDRLPGTGVLVELLPGSLTVIIVGAFVGFAGWSLGTTRKKGRAASQSQARAAGVTLAIGGALLASRRTSGGGGRFLDGVREFETILVQVRATESMLVVSSASVSSALAFVALLLATIALFLDSSTRSSAVVSSEMQAAGALRAAVLFSVLSISFVALGSTLMERSSLLFLVTLWPVRVAWVVVLVFVAVLAIRIFESQSLHRLGVVPIFGVGLAILQGAILGRSTWSIALIAVAFVWIFSRGVRPLNSWVADLPRKPSVEVFTVAVTLLIMASLLGNLAAPEVSIASSMDRIEAEGGTNAEVVQMARAARELTSPDARILIPFSAGWSAFRLLSERGVAFEWKQFVISQPLDWYEQLRWMCDPDYRLNADEDFSFGAQDVEECHDSLSASEINRVAEAFGADFAVVRGAIAQDMNVARMTVSGDYALVALR